jgi:tight adherence protein C
MIAVIAALAAFVAVAALFAWAAGLLRSPVEARLTRMATSAATPGRTPMEAPFSDRVFIPVVDGVVRAFVQLLPSTFVARTSRQLLSAGSPMTTQAFFTAVLLTAALLPAGVAFLLISADAISTFTIVLLVFFVAVGFMLPLLWLRRRVQNRKLAIWRRLPDMFDMVTVCVEAGLGLDAALRQVSAKIKGPLADEIALTLRQVGMGRPRREALEDMVYRVDVPEVTTFVNAVIQAEQLGTSLGRVLRAQTFSLRVARRQRAEEIARRAPVKMVFPLVLFIMPAFFIVTVGPMVIHFVKYVSGN